MKFHKLAGLFPLIEGAEFESFVADIKARGLNEPIIRYQGAILDGRNRWRACEKAKVKPRFEDYRGKDPLGFVISANIHRRQMNETQRALVAKRCITTSQGGDRKSTDQKGNFHFDREKASALFNVDPKTISFASKVLEKGAPELVRACDRGLIAVSRAASIAKKPAPEQKKIVAKLLNGESSAPKDKPKGNALVRIWDSAKPHVKIVFIKARGDQVREMIQTLEKA